MLIYSVKEIFERENVTVLLLESEREIQVPRTDTIVVIDSQTVEILASGSLDEM